MNCLLPTISSVNYVLSKIRLSVIPCKYYSCHFPRTHSSEEILPFLLAIFLCLTVTPQHPSFYNRRQVKGRNQDVLDQLVLKIFYITLDPHIFTYWFKNLCSFLWTVFLLMWWLYRDPWEKRMKWNISPIIHCNSLKSGWNWPFKMSLILSAKCAFVPLF